MNREETLDEFEKLVDFKLTMLKLTRSMSNNDYDKQRVMVLDCYDYIKENLK